MSKSAIQTNAEFNVAILASAYHPHVGGVEEVVRQTANEYRKRGIGVVVVTNRWPRSLRKQEILEGVPVYRLALRIAEGSLKARINFQISHKYIQRRVAKILLQHRINLLHVHCVSANGYYALTARKATSLPLVVTTHGERTMDASGIYRYSRCFNRILRTILAVADHVTACSRETLDDVERFSGKEFGGRANVIYGGISPEEFENLVPYVGERRYILGMGRLVPQKGFEILIEAFAKSALDLDLLIAGEGPERRKLEQLVFTLGLRERVKFFGRADRKAATALFAGCRFFVTPSLQEPMGIVNLEAMAAGKAVIASRVGGIPEIVVDGETGMLFPVGDVVGLSERMNFLDNDDGIRLKMGQAGRLRSLKFRWSEIAEQYLAIYRRVLTV